MAYGPHTVLVDAEDADILARCCVTQGYVKLYHGGNRKDAKVLLLHRFLVGGAARGDLVDHKNRIRTDNRRANLRRCTYAQSSQNRRPKRRGLKGVCPTPWGHYQATITHERKSIWLGDYPTPEHAARAYDIMAYQLQGEFAVLNFPV